jgi:hypothetical protein
MIVAEKIVMNEFSENATCAAFCPKCGEKHPTNFINSEPNTFVVCPNRDCGHNYFPFGKSVDKLVPPNLGF